MLEIEAGAADSGMDWLEFIASIVGAIAWPVAVAFVAFLFRVEIRALFKRIKEVGFGGATVSLTGELLSEAEETAKELPPPPDEPEPAPPVSDVGGDQVEVLRATAPKNDREVRFFQLLSVSPNAAILNSWLELENAIRDYAMRSGHDDIEGNAMTMAMVLKKYNLLPNSAMSVIHELQRIRNRAVHSLEDIAPSDAIRFYELTIRVTDLLKRGPSGSA